MDWFWIAVLGGAAGGLAAHIRRKAGIALPRWNRVVRVLRLGFLAEMAVGAIAGPVGAFFVLVVTGGVPPVPEGAAVLGLLVGFVGGPYLDRVAADRLHVNLAAKELGDEQVGRVRRLRGNTHSATVKEEGSDGGADHGGGTH